MRLLSSQVTSPQPSNSHANIGFRFWGRTVRLFKSLQSERISGRHYVGLLLISLATLLLELALTRVL
jgi:hypothetical protein